LVVAGVLRHPQAHVSMEWDDLLGQGCTYYQTYNPSGQNLGLSGVEAALEFDFDAGTFVALIEAPTHGSEPGAEKGRLGATGGWDGWGRAVVVIAEGKMTPREGGSGWDLEATGASGLYYSMVGECVVPGGRKRMPPFAKQTQGTVAVSGSIDPVYPNWELDLMAIDSERDAMIKAGTYSSTNAPSQRFRLDLIDVPIQSQK
jgi:hypothetical protein